MRIAPPPPPDVNLKVKSLYIYGFTSMVEWPKDMKTGDFKVAFLGDEAQFNDFKTRYSTKSAGNQQIKIDYYSDLSQVPVSQLIYVAKEKSEKIADVVKKFKSKGSLVISEKEGGLKEGSSINFIIRSNKLCYELSKSNATKSKLIIGKQLTELAVRIE